MIIGVLNTGVIRNAGDTRPLKDLYEESIARVERLEQLGYDFILLGEHHFMESQWNPSPLMLLSAFATRTSRLRLGTNVLLTPFYSPLRLAEDVAVLDNLSNGRVELVCGSASITGEFNTYNIDPEERFGRMWETMRFLRHAFSEERFDHRGKYFHFPNVRLTTRPVQHPFPVWFGGFGPKNFARAGREGFHLFGVGREGAMAAYEEGLRQGGHDPDSLNLGMAGGNVTVVENAQEAAEIKDRVLAAARAHAEEYSERGRDLAFQTIRPEWVEPLIGTPDQVLAYLEPRFKKSRATHFQTGGGPRHLELFAREVAPTLRAWGRNPVKGVTIAA